MRASSPSSRPILSEHFAETLTSKKIHDAREMDPKTPDKASWVVKGDWARIVIMFCMDAFL
jgi:hypothetical protein